jgi:multiple sugar transport system ATP-binding protein
MTMADKIVVMHDGIVEQIGTPLELYDRPGNRFVAGFIGSPAMNFIDGKVSGEGFVSNSGFRLPLKAAPAASDGTPVVYGLRPEHIALDPAGVPITVKVVEPTGSETQVFADAGGQQIVCVFRERISAAPGETIHISANPDLAHLFDMQDGKRLIN